MAKSEFYLMPKSKLIGKSLEEIEEEYGVKVLHVKPYSSNHKDYILQERDSIKIEGLFEKIRGVIKDSI